MSFTFTLTASAQQAPEQRDSLLADFDLFIEYVEATHPDPYTPHGRPPLLCAPRPADE